MACAQVPKWERCLRSEGSEEVLLRLVRGEDHEMRKERWEEDQAGPDKSRLDVRQKAVGERDGLIKILDF